MEISEKAWRAFAQARTMLMKCSMWDLQGALSEKVIPQETLDGIKEIGSGAYANFLSWEALDTMEGLLELMIAIQTMKNAGQITVKMDETGDISMPASIPGTGHPADHGGSHHPDDRAVCRQDSADT